MLTRDDFRPYQTHLTEIVKQCWATDPAARLPGVILALEPGAGKTGLVLTALRDLLDQFVIRKALIVAPLLVAQTTWPDEFGEWAHLKALTWTLIRVEDGDEEVRAAGDAAFQDSRACGVPPKVAEKDRQAAVAAAKEAKLRRLAAEDTEIHIINKEALPWIWANFRDGKDWPYDVVVGDDLREFRSGKRRSKGKKDAPRKGPAPLSRWGVLARSRKHIDAMIELSGTPTPKGLVDMWGLVYPVDLGERLGTSKTAFLQRWFDQNRYTYEIKPKAHAEREITERVRDVMFSLDPADMAALPEYICDPIRVRLPTKALEEYRRFERQMVSDEWDVEAVNGGVLHGKLLQAANGSMYQEDGNDIPIHDAKLEALKALVERMNGTPLLVAYSFQFDVQRICQAFPKAVVLAPENAVETKRLWNEDRIELLLAHRASAGHGLNLQKGTGHMCEYGLTSDAELYLQFLKRIRRPGRKTTVFNHVIIAEGTIDDDVFPMYLDPKIATQERILEAVRVRCDSPR